MANTTIPAAWTESDTKRLVSELRQRKAQSGDGGNFKKATFEEVAAILEVQRTVGGPKTWKACSNKWGAVRISIYDQCCPSFAHCDTAVDSSGVYFVPSKLSRTIPDGPGVTRREPTSRLTKQLDGKPL